MFILARGVQFPGLPSRKPGGLCRPHLWVNVKFIRCKGARGTPYWVNREGNLGMMYTVTDPWSFNMSDMVKASPLDLQICP